MASIFKSSIGKKLVQSISGLFLILFLTIHATVNFFSVIDSVNGTFGVSAADDKLFSAGDGLFQLGCDFMSTPFVGIMVPVLALGFIVHILWAFWLTLGNLKSRGGLNRYAVSSKAKADSWAARNMFVLGIVVLGFLGFHLTHFWADMQLQEILGNEAENPYLLLTTTFGRWWVLLLYLIWFGALWFHLTHGFWSAFQTLGWNNMTWIKRLKVIGSIIVSIEILMLAAVGINAFLQAQA